MLVDSPAAEEALAWIKEQEGTVISADAALRSSADGPWLILARIPVAALLEADQLPWIRSMEASRLLFPKLDVARGQLTRLDEALAAHPLTGDGVVVGIIDTGIDWQHDDFRNKDGTTRIDHFVHIVSSQAGMPQITMYTRKDLNEALQGLPKGIPLGDELGHGTHCASIAAGNGNASHGGLRGVAPGATIVAVRSDPLEDQNVIQGLRLLFEIAGTRPAVANISLGGHRGGHDGTSALEFAIDQMSGPGHIVVAAAGNEALSAIHFSGDLAEGSDFIVKFRVADPDYQYVDVWIPRGDQVDLYVDTPDRTSFVPDGTLHYTQYGTLSALFLENNLNRDQHLAVELWGGVVEEEWEIRIRPQEILHGKIHAWAGTNNPRTSFGLFPKTGSPDCTVCIPATANRAIAVGSIVNRNQFSSAAGPQDYQFLTPGELSAFSSRGPTRFGVQKPDIVAPGQFITAALATGSFFESEPDLESNRGVHGPYITLQGTSMSAPFVTGVIALLLEREPKLNTEEIRKRLQVTAHRDKTTGRVWNEAFGFGKLDVLAFLEYSGVI